MSDPTTTPQLTETQITAEDATRRQLAAALAQRTEKFNNQAPAVVAVAETKPATPLAARLAELSTPAPSPKTELSGAARSLRPLIEKATALMARFDAERAKVTDAIAQYAIADVRRIVNLVPPSDDLGSNWFRLRELVSASKEVTSLVASSTYADFAKLTGIVEQFASGAITTYVSPERNRNDAIPSADAALMYYEPMVKRFENNVTAFEGWLALIAQYEPLVIADFKLAEQAPALKVDVLPVAVEIRERPMHYGNYDPFNPPAPRDESVKEVVVEGGVRIGSVQVPEWPANHRRDS
jgi:hypothetical protein